VYLLYEPLGAGGVSSVYKAVQRGDYLNHVFYAVKLLRSDKAADSGVLDDFLYEAGIHEKVSPHPNIVRFIELGHDGNEYFHVMGFVRGDSIKHRVENSGRIPEKIALQWTREACAALRHIREQGFLYRDISPGNLLIRSDNTACLIDFGLALTLEDADAADSRNEIVGTPEYMPPERVQHLGEDERSSIYALGMMLFFMVKGEPLIKGTSNKRAALQHVSSIRVAFNERMLPPDISPGVVALIGAMIQYDPVDRPESLDNLDKILAGLIAA
jgi:serine/threonine protein kinase